MQLWGRVPVPSQGIYIIISLSLSVELKPQQIELFDEAVFIPGRRRTTRTSPEATKHQLFFFFFSNNFFFIVIFIFSIIADLNTSFETQCKLASTLIPLPN